MSERAYDSSANADFEEALRRYVNDAEASETADRAYRRRAPRFAYDTTQWIAPRSANAPSDVCDFREVPCRNISTGGFAFLLPLPPDFEELVVRLGDGDRVILATARVVHTAPNKAGDGFVVGCQFTGRLPSG